MQTADVINQLAAFPSKRAHSEDVHEAARSEVLSKLPPRQVLNLFYSRKLSLQRPAVVTGIRSRFNTRKELLTWVYRDDRVFQDVNYVRLPSLEKRILVSRLVGYAQKRFGWITPRLLHAFAFRPEFFREKARSNPQHQWTALYRRVSIPKGKSGHRDLWVPSPPLRRVQRCLLELSLNRALGELPSCVNGCRPRLPGDPRFGIYRNAASHLGQQYVASFDLADFFPSVKVADIIPALLAIKTPMVLKSPDAESPEAVPFAWTHDAAVFVARLVTHRGQYYPKAPQLLRPLRTSFSRLTTIES